MNSNLSAAPDSINPRRWYVCPHLNPGAETRLFFFPYAGGGPSVFGKWLGNLPPNMEGYIAHYPGRGSRYKETPVRHLATLVERLCEAIQPLLDKPFAFFGHSLGGLIAFELTRQLRQLDLPQPQILFVSACSPPHLRDPHPPIHALPDSEFVQSLQQLNGIPDEILHQPDAMELFLPMLRADFEAAESYQYSPDSPPLGVPILALGGLDDLRVNPEQLDDWAMHTRVHFKSQLFPGDHFFINTAREAVLEAIAVEIRPFHHARR